MMSTEPFVKQTRSYSDSLHAPKSCLLILAILFSLGASPATRAEEQTTSAEELVKTNCMQCHRADNPNYPDHNIGWVFGKRYTRVGWLDNISRMQAIALKDEYITEPWSEADRNAMADYLTKETEVRWRDIDRVGMGHYSVVHFPIALLMVALFFELFSLLFGWPMKRDYLHATVWLAWLSAIVAVALGIVLIWEVSALSEDLSDHRIAGFATLGLLTLALIAREIAISRNSTTARWLYRLLLVVACVSAGAAGHLGGTLVHGEYLPQWITG